MSELAPGRLFIDGRKLGDGGIGTSIELLVSGILELYEKSSSGIVLNILVPESFLRKNKTLISRWEDSGCVVIPDNCPKYSLRELFLLPLIHKKIISSCDWYISPHYVLPFFIQIKKSVFIHDIIHLQYPEKPLTRFIADLLIRSAIRRSDKLITVSGNSRRRILEMFPTLNPGKIYIVPNATIINIQSAVKEISKDEIIKILWVGADRQHKRLDFFLDFLNFLSKINVQFQATIVSALRSDSIKKIRDMSLEDQVTIASGIPENELHELYSETDFYVTTSIEEGFCIPLLDAMRSKVPVLCPELPFSRELAGEYAWFYNHSSVEDAVFQFVRMINDHESRKEKCQRAFQKSLNYTPTHMAKTFLTSLAYVSE
jgi:glycosyltransferase involved in cell wall biosynthesis